MKEINIEELGREKIYEFFKSFPDSTYGMNVELDVTNLVKIVKENKKSFFIDFLYIVLKGLNSVDEMRMRLVEDKPVIYDDINPSFTVLTNTGNYVNVRCNNYKDYKTFYNEVRIIIDQAKETSKMEVYNPEKVYNEYYITCTPWINFSSMTHPIPGDKALQCIPRICWGKYEQDKDRYKITLNITVSHIFVDGYPLSRAFNNIQEYLNNIEDILR